MEERVDITSDVSRVRAAKRREKDSGVVGVGRGWVRLRGRCWAKKWEREMSVLWC